MTERRHWLTCITCGHDYTVATARPRVPICTDCAEQARAQAERERRWARMREEAEAAA
jgi:hypothetical protein